jgi:DNA-binding Lrp family transcriptional regulator
MLKEARVNIPLIQHFAESDKIKTLAYFYFFKFHFTNSKIYTDGLRAIARKFNISPTTLKRHLSELEAMGLIQYADGYYSFPKVKTIVKQLKIKENGAKFWDGIKYDTAKAKPQTIQYLLEYLLIKNNINQQKHVISKKAEIINLFSKSIRNEYLNKREFSLWKKMSRKYFQFTGKSITSDEDIKHFLKYDEAVSISNYRIGELINRSKATGSRRQAKWNDCKIIKSAMRIKVIMQNITFADFTQLQKFDILPIYNCFFKDGNVYTRLANNVLTLDSIKK